MQSLSVKQRTTQSLISNCIFRSVAIFHIYIVRVCVFLHSKMQFFYKKWFFLLRRVILDASFLHAVDQPLHPIIQFL